jgi:hypothetical protein
MAEERGRSNEMEEFRRLDERFQEVDQTLGGIVDQVAFYSLALREFELDPRTTVRVAAFTRLCTGAGWQFPRGDGDDQQYDWRRSPFALMSNMEESGLFEPLEQLWAKLQALPQPQEEGDRPA